MRVNRFVSTRVPASIVQPPAIRQTALSRGTRPPARKQGFGLAQTRIEDGRAELPAAALSCRARRSASVTAFVSFW